MHVKKEIIQINCGYNNNNKIFRCLVSASTSTKLLIYSIPKINCVEDYKQTVYAKTCIRADIHIAKSEIQDLQISTAIFEKIHH